MHGSERTRVSDGDTEAAAGNTTINYEVASTAVETAVVTAGMDAAAVPEAGNSGSGYGSGNSVDVGSGNNDYC